jgi:CRISPR-associated protein Cas1
MMKMDLHILPKLKDSMTFLYVEHCMIEQDDQAVVKIDQQGRTPIPIASFAVLMLGPGVSITHDAIANIARCGCMAVWCGEKGGVFYAFGKGETRSGRNLLLQVKMYSDQSLHIQCVRRMYMMRFPEMPNDNLTIEQLRGAEGVRVKMAYKNASKHTGVKWEGRSYKDTEWNEADPINMALSVANATLYALCYSAIISLGYSPGIGFIHTGRAEAFVYDIADLYKAETTIPLAFEAVSSNEQPLDRVVRRKCHEYFKRYHILKRIPEDISYIFYSPENDEVMGSKQLWSEEGENVQGGLNYSGRTK